MPVIGLRRDKLIKAKLTHESDRPTERHRTTGTKLRTQIKPDEMTIKRSVKIKENERRRSSHTRSRCGG